MSKLIVDTAGISTLDITGSLLIDRTEYTYGNAQCTFGTSSIIEWPTSSYNAAFFNYTALSSSNMRAGQIISVWNNNTASYTETTTMDIGNTTDVSMNVEINSSYVKLNAEIDNGTWIVKSSVNLI